MALVGYINSQTPEHILNFSQSFFGGNLITFPHVEPPPVDKIQCMVCRKPMDFIMQLYCPIGDSKYHRALYIFVCINGPCQSSGNNWKVLRSQYFIKFDQDSQLKPCTDWCAEYQNDSSDGESWGQDADKGSEIQCKAENLNEQSSSLTGRFQCYSIDIYEDTTITTTSSSPTVEPEIGTTNHDDYNIEVISNLPSIKHFLSKCSEKVLIDKEFIEEDDNTGPEAFSDELLSYISNRGEYGCEDIRYCWSGQPIFNGLPPNDLTNYSICHRCGSERVFELQIFSTINNSLKLSTLFNEDFDGVNISWLLNIVTVLIFTCRDSCWSQTTDDWVEECVIVQTDKNVTKIISPS
ncbi:unnamed protein product [Schistosoma spindalis]|nr:unnamed protein product [Schistosoma spindale]